LKGPCKAASHPNLYCLKAQAKARGIVSLYHEYGIKMKQLVRNDPLNFLARNELKRLEIHFPNATQLMAMREMLMELGTLSTRLTLAPNLSQQEIACLVWITRGKTAAEIAHLLQLQHTTVRNYLTRIKRKLRATTMPQAVYEAIRYSYIRPKLAQEE
jgi:DNA-binding CsgD family transcriptional regulator